MPSCGDCTANFNDDRAASDFKAADETFRHHRNARGIATDRDVEACWLLETKGPSAQVLQIVDEATWRLHRLVQASGVHCMGPLATDDTAYRVVLARR